MVYIWVSYYLLGYSLAPFISSLWRSSFFCYSSYLGSLEFAGSEGCRGNTDLGLLPTALLDAVETSNTLLGLPTGTFRLHPWQHCLSLLNHSGDYESFQENFVKGTWLKSRFWPDLLAPHRNFQIKIRSRFLPMTAGHSILAEHWTEETRKINVVLESSITRVMCRNCLPN